jgi:hypothetical protein
MSRPVMTMIGGNYRQFWLRPVRGDDLPSGYAYIEVVDDAKEPYLRVTDQVGFHGYIKSREALEQLAEDINEALRKHKSGVRA